MGLAQLMQRPRNWDLADQAISDNFSQVEDGEFVAFVGATSMNAIEEARSITFPYDVIIERMWCMLDTNAWTAASTDTLTLRVNQASTAHIIDMDDTTAIDTLIEITGLAQSATAGQRICALWNSDSAGVSIIRAIGISYRIVNPRA